MNFTKMHALGNDFVFVELFTQKLDDPASFARFVSHRKYGIGSDGLILISSSDNAQLKMTMYNSDGTKAQMCGNALRCLGKYAYTRKLVGSESFLVETDSGIKPVSVTVEDGKVVSVRANIGEPNFTPEKIPCSTLLWDTPVTVVDKEFRLFSASVGNPHCAVFVDDVCDVDLPKYGSALENSELFPERTNVEFLQIIDRGKVKMRVWERGCGETWACGTGSSASAAMGIKSGVLDNRVSMIQPGGTLVIEWNDDGNGIYMTSDAEFVFDGTVDTGTLEIFERKYEHVSEGF